MTTCRPKKLQAVSLPGLTLDTLGLYFAALGLLRLLSRQWPQVRGCWRNGVFTLLNGPKKTHDIASLIETDYRDERFIEIGRVIGKKWRAPWYQAQKKNSDKKASSSIIQWRAECNTEKLLPLLDSHIVASARLNFNPLFGTGGNAGARIFAEGWMDAKFAIETLLADEITAQTLATTLHAFLLGQQVEHPPYPKRKPSQKSFGWNAGSWFSLANKVYNSGLRKPFAEGQITPWAMLLACEAFPILSGSTSRLIGAHRKQTAAFPFVFRAPAPESETACGQWLGDFWAPVWRRPFSLAEATAIFQSGKAELDGKAALTSAAFAGAIVQRGVDSGLSEFRCFTLQRTTSDNTFESQLSRVIPIPKQNPIFSEVFRRILIFRDRLPEDRKQGKSWRFKGLQGPLDRALLDLAQVIGEGKEERQIEAALAVLDAQFAALAKVNRNKAHRESKVAFERLPLDFFAWLAKSEGGSAEFRLALAIASMRSEIPAAITKPDERIRLPQALLAYRLGATGRGRFWSIPKDRPLRAVWSPRDLIDNLCALARRRIIESPASGIAPFRSHFPAPVSDIAAFLRGETDDALLARWIDRLSLFDWKYDRELRDNLNPDDSSMAAWSGETALYAYFRPLLHDELLRGLQKQISPENRYLKRGDDKPLLDRWAKRKNEPVLATAARISPVLAALERDETAAAWASAKSVFHTARIPIADFGPDPHFACHDPRRLLATLIIPAQTTGLYDYFRKHWKAPSQPKPNHEAA